MTLDRAIMLPHEFDKKEDHSPVDDTDLGAVEVLRSPTKNSLMSSQERHGHTRVETTEKR